MRAYRIKGKTELGIMTVNVLNFNNTDHKFIPRCRAADLIESRLDEAMEKLDWFIEKQDVRRGNTFKNLVEAILGECQKQSAFAATSATTLHSSDTYKQLKDSMMELNIWTDYMQELHDASLMLKLPDC